MSLIPRTGPADPRRVLFVCTLNAVRSPMAAALLTQLRGPRVATESGGVLEGAPDGFTVSVMRELGVDLASHQPRRLQDVKRIDFDLIVTLSPEAHHQALEFTRDVAVPVEYWPTEDPTAVEGNREERLAAYRKVRDALAKRIRARFPAPLAPQV